MHTAVIRNTPHRSDTDRLGPSTVARVDSRATCERTVAALTLRERLLLSVGIQVACCAIRAAELLAGEGWRGGRRHAVRAESPSLRR